MIGQGQIQILPNEFYLLTCVISMQKRYKIYLTESCQTKVVLILQNLNKLQVNVPKNKNRPLLPLFIRGKLGTSKIDCCDKI